MKLILSLLLFYHIGSTVKYDEGSYYIQQYPKECTGNGMITGYELNSNHFYFLVKTESNNCPERKLLIEDLK